MLSVIKGKARPFQGPVGEAQPSPRPVETGPWCYLVLAAAEGPNPLSPFLRREGGTMDRELVVMVTWSMLKDNGARPLSPVGPFQRASDCSLGNYRSMKTQSNGNRLR